MPLDPAERHGFAMADHGLFVAGIVHDIVGGDGAEIRLIRVLNDHGVGDLLAISHVLEDLLGLVLGHGNTGAGAPRLIVNLSLGAVPSHAKHRERWLPGLHEKQRTATNLPPGSEGLLDAAHLSLRDSIDWLHAHDVLVVASAGNDALRDFAREAPPPPRYPAHYQKVFAVAATNAEGNPAIYSNRADTEPAPNGVATFGGDAVVPKSPSQPPHTETGATPAGRGNAVVGIYSGERLPGGAENRTGWVQWAGTSFAAPVISGLAAHVWAQNPHYSADQLMKRVRDFAQWSRAAQPLDAPAIDAWQVHQPMT
jgi:subtilisin family serine protease